jgi:hypothetical protein
MWQKEACELMLASLFCFVPAHHFRMNYWWFPYGSFTPVGLTLEMPLFVAAQLCGYRQER